MSEIVSLELFSPPELATVANREHALARQAFSDSIGHAVKAGEALLAAKVQVRHGEWLSWLEANFDGSERTAQVYMRVAANPQTSADSIDKALQALTVQERQPRELPPPPQLPAGQFAVIYCDPPWRYDFVATPAARAIENQYPTMGIDEIAALDVPAANDAVLFMWATSPKLCEALAVIESWGFEYRTNMVWVKDRIGMGYYVRAQHELLLVAKRGAMPLPSESALPPSVIHAPRGQHSQKPREVYAIIDALYPEYPKVELFARNTWDGWHSWGNEVAA